MIRNTTFCILLFGLISGCDKQNTPQQIAPVETKGEQKTSAKVGRYQIIFNPNARVDTFLLDTQKGRVWQMTKFTDLPGQPTVWNQTEVIDESGEIGVPFLDFLKANRPPPSK